MRKLFIAISFSFSWIALGNPCHQLLLDIAANLQNIRGHEEQRRIVPDGAYLNRLRFFTGIPGRDLRPYSSQTQALIAGFQARIDRQGQVVLTDRLNGHRRIIPIDHTSQITYANGEVKTVADAAISLKFSRSGEFLGIKTKLNGFLLIDVWTGRTAVSHHAACSTPLQMAREGNEANPFENQLAVGTKHWATAIWTSATEGQILVYLPGTYEPVKAIDFSKQVPRLMVSLNDRMLAVLTAKQISFHDFEDDMLSVLSSEVPVEDLQWCELSTDGRYFAAFWLADMLPGTRSARKAEVGVFSTIDGDQIRHRTIRMRTNDDEPLHWIGFAATPSAPDAWVLATYHAHLTDNGASIAQVHEISPDAIITSRAVFIPANIENLTIRKAGRSLQLRISRPAGSGSQNTVVGNRRER